MAADVVGYSRLMGADETGTLAALRTCRNEIIDPLVDRHGGRIVKTMGDGLLLEFPSVVAAVEWAVLVQDEIVGRNRAIEESARIRFRIGIHLGDVIVEDDDIFGDGVNIAARIEPLSKPDGLCLSDDAYRLVRDRVNVLWEDGGEQHVKNMTRAIRVWHRKGGQRPGSRPSPAEGAIPEMPDKPSIAVLPFDNMSGDDEQGYFADGIAEDIITELTRIPSLLVIARNSSFTYRGTATTVQEICRDLRVRTVLEGSVRKSGRRVRVSAQLIDGKSGGHLWAEKFDGELADIFEVQDEITGQIVRALEGRLMDIDNTRSARAEPIQPEAYDLVLRGREQYRLFTGTGNALARRHFERAIALDPGYAGAYAGLAEACKQDWFLGVQGGLDRAQELALEAKRLDPNLPLVYEALSGVYLFKRQHDEALEAASRWLEIEPGNAEAHVNLAGILQFSGKPGQVFELIGKAKRLNPLYPFYYNLYLGQASFTLHCFDDAADYVRRSIDQNPDSLPSQIFIAAIYGHLGEDKLAGDAIAEARRISPEFSLDQARAIFAYRRPADTELLIEGLRKAGMPD